MNKVIRSIQIARHRNLKPKGGGKRAWPVSFLAKAVKNYKLDDKKWRQRNRSDTLPVCQ